MKIKVTFSETHQQENTHSKPSLIGRIKQTFAGKSLIDEEEEESSLAEVKYNNKMGKMTKNVLA